MVDYERAIKRPFGDIKTLLIGIIVQIIPVVNFAATGYHLKCAKTAMNNDFKLPEFDDWVKLFITGLIAAVIEFVYMIPAAVVMFLSVGFSFFGMLTGASAGSNGMAFASLGGMAIGFFVAIILMILAAYISPLAVFAYVVDERIGDAFKIKAVLKKALTVKYLTVWLISVIYTMILAGVLSIIPWIGTSAGMFVGLVTAATLLGEVYKGL